MDFDKIFEFTVKHEDIVRFYKKIHIFVFKYLILILALILGSLFAIRIINHKTPELSLQQEMFEVQKVSLKGQFENFLSKFPSETGFDMLVMQGQFDNTGNYIKSANNLMLYNGFVMPRFVFFYKTLPLKDKSYFDLESYSLDELEAFAENIIFTRPIPLEEQFSRVQLDLNSNIYDTFNLSCLQKGQLFLGSCNYYIEDFLDSFFVYDLSQDYYGLEQVFNKISKKSDYKKQFCENIENYILFSQDNSVQLEQIFIDCGEQEKFEILEGFIEIQNQFVEDNISDDIYYHEVLNSYKLISIQQMLYQDIASQKFNQRNLVAYVSFLQNMMKKNMLSGFCKDVTYWFNTYYLKSKLRMPIYDSKKKEVDIIINELNTINRGSELMGFEGLSQQITNGNLAVAKDDNGLILIENLPSLSLSDLVKQIQNMSFMKITQENILDTTAELEGIMTVDYNNKELELETQLTLRLRENNLLVDSLVFPEYPQLNTSIKTVLAANDYSLTHIYQYLTENISLYLTDKTEVDFCDQLSEQIKNISVQYCDNTRIEFNKSVSAKKINFAIDLDNFVITDISISDEELQTEAIEMLQGIQTNSFNLYAWLEKISALTDQEETILENPNSESILLLTEKLQKYLNLTPSNTYQKENTIVFDFSINNTNFLGLYEIETNTITTVYFADVYIRQGSQLVVRNFNLVLDDDHQTDANLFITEPLDYIQKVNSTAYNAYLKYK